MGLDFGKSSMGNPAQAGNGLQEKNEIEVVEKYDIVADRQQMNAELVNSKEVDDIVSTIEVYNMDTIVSFGAKAAEEISKASDVVLNSMNMSQLNETSEMLKSLAKIMDQFDINEIKDNPGLFGKLFGNFRKQPDGFASSQPSPTITFANPACSFDRFTFCPFCKLTDIFVPPVALRHYSTSTP